MWLVQRVFYKQWSKSRSIRLFQFSFVTIPKEIYHNIIKQKTIDSIIDSFESDTAHQKHDSRGRTSQVYT